ncbi:MAG: sulfoxide reductase heme-binding subunit YedZ [Cocleimonas sp.]|nr:sulfoxide reductase heme-binding subunit YedZ [Cocleimonas sp.]
MKLPNKLFRQGLKPLIFIVLLIPALHLGWGLWYETLGANPFEAIIRGLGDWALRILLLTLAVSPLRRLTNWGQLLRLRRMLGLYAYFYAVLHLLGYLLFEQFFDWTEIWYDITERPFITVGMLAILLLTPLAITSTKGMIRRMGKNWKRLHLLIYPIALLSVLHFFWMVKLDISEPVLYTLILVVLLGERFVNSLRRSTP